MLVKTTLADNKTGSGKRTKATIVTKKERLGGVGELLVASWEPQRGAAQGMSRCGYPIVPVTPQPSWICQRHRRQVVPLAMRNKNTSMRLIVGGSEKIRFEVALEAIEGRG